MKLFFKTFTILAYAAGLAFAAAVAYYGRSYYTLALVDRPHHMLHSLLKPGGFWGHGLGIIGTSMVLLLFLYSARKREKFFLRFGPMRRWLNIHIFFGIMGPVLITLHTAMKFNGIVSISYFSMLAVMFSGILGRYIYMQIPRDPSGAILSLEQIAAKDQAMSKQLVEQYGLSASAQRRIQQISEMQAADSGGGLSSLFRIMANDLKRPILLRKLQREIRAQNLRIPPEVFAQVMPVVKQKALLLRKKACLDTANQIFHYWHVVHKPFAYVMIIIMFVHVMVAVTFGYRWIF